VKERLSRVVDVERVIVGGASRTESPKKPRRENDSRTVRVQTEILDRFIDLTGELITTRYMLQNAAQDGDLEELSKRLDQQSRLIGDLHHRVLQVRIMPLESITGRLPRLVRDLARSTGKEAVLRLEGEDVELDRAILERLTDPLMHLVRNAVDHGIEKSGTVLVRAWREKDMVTLEVADDGRGMDPEKIRRKALEKGIITPAQGRSLGEGEILQLVCIPGFSTADRITETSGRGVGMDVVKSVVEGMGGTLGIDSVRGRGTRFLLQLPLSVAIIHILLVECDGHLLGIPFTRVRKALELSTEEIRSAGSKTTTMLDGEEIPLLSLRKILQLPATRFQGTVPVVVTEARGRRVGLVPDRLAGQRQAFVKGLSFPLDRLQGVTGSTVLGDGSVIFIIDPQSLLEGRPGTSRPTGEQTCTSIA
jgi:two-component system chemotaxis sensor kinase CheA